MKELTDRLLNQLNRARFKSELGSLMKFKVKYLVSGARQMSVKYLLCASC